MTVYYYMLLDRLINLLFIRYKETKIDIIFYYILICNNF